MHQKSLVILVIALAFTGLSVDGRKKYRVTNPRVGSNRAAQCPAPNCQCPQQNYNGTTGDLCSPDPSCSPITCTYTVTVPAGHKVMLQGLVYEYTDPNYAFLSIYDGPTVNSANLIAGLTANSMLYADFIYSGSNTLTAVYTNGDWYGFEVSYQSIPSNCGQQPQIGYLGTIQSPNWIFNYPNNINCIWTIQVASGTVNLAFYPESITQQNMDYVTVYDGKYGSGKQIARYSGSGPWKSLQGSTNTVAVKFTSGPTGIANGFKATWTAIQPGCSCGSSDISVKTSGNLTSPNYPRNYCNYASCVWYLQAPLGYKIQLHFLAFNTELNQDVLAIYDGIMQYQLQQCSGLVCLDVTSGSNDLKLTFVSDGGAAFSGFAIQYTAIPSNTL